MGFQMCRSMLLKSCTKLEATQRKLKEIPTSISAFPPAKAVDGQMAADTLDSALLDPNSEASSKLNPEHDYSIYPFDDQAPILADNLGTFQVSNVRPVMATRSFSTAEVATYVVNARVLGK